MGPQDPEASDLSWEESKLRLDRVDDGAGAPITCQERWRIWTVDRVLRIAGECMGKEAAVNVQKSCYADVKLG